MKNIYRFYDGDVIEADLDDLKALLADDQKHLDNYFELLSSMDDEDYVARGNGFCDSKFSSDFLEGQIAKYRDRIEEIKDWIDTY